MTDDVRKLLAGYATNTLTEAERRELFDASLHDPALFEALADEQALRELLDDPASRAALLAGIEPVPLTLRDRFAAWLRRPATVAVLGTAAVAVTAISIIPLLRHSPAAPTFQEVAKVTPPQRIEPAPPPLAQASPEPPQTPAPREKAKASDRPVDLSQPAAPPPPGPASGMVVNGALPSASPPEQIIIRGNSQLAGEAKAKVQADAVPLAPSVAERNLADAGVQSMAYLAPAPKAVKQADIHFALLKRNPGGDYVEVPADTQFDSGDTVRVQVQTSHPALVTIVESDSGHVLFSRRADGVAETGDILLAADRTLSITETPLSGSDALAGGVIGGALPSGAPGGRMKSAQLAIAPHKVSDTPSTTILLRVKKR